LIVAATVLLGAAAAPVAADHGYWPASGVTPAKVTSHAAATAETTTPSYWGHGCETVDNGGSGMTGGGLDTYGAVLDADYDLAVIVADDVVSGLSQGWFPGPNGITVFESPKAGEFVWADTDGNSQFANTHETDATLLFLCGGSNLPATDMSGPAHASSSLREAGVRILLLVVSGATFLHVLVRPRHSRSRDIRER
jgi:hypothetical protein